MLDEDLKKLLIQLKMEEVVQAFEKEPQIKKEPVTPIDEPCKKEPPAPQKSYPLILTMAAVLVVCAACLVFNKEVQEPDVLIAQVDDFDEDEIQSTPIVEKIAAMNRDCGQGVQILLKMVTRRQEELVDIANQISKTLEDNAERQQDFSLQEASTLLSRYQATNARFAFEIANQIYLVQSLIQKQASPLLSQYFNEFLAEYGFETYTNYQLQVVKQLIKQEDEYKKYLEEISASKSLAELSEKLKNAKESFSILEKNGFAQTFLQLELLKQEIDPSTQRALEKIFQEGNIQPGSDAEALLDTILAEAALSLEDRKKWQSKIDKKELSYSEFV